MNNSTHLNGEYARTLMELRGQTRFVPRPARSTARKSLATRLHRLANRLDGN